jgi:PAS domain S-box-containing protein
MLLSTVYPVRGSDPGFSIFLPTYRDGVFTGLVFGVFRLQDLKKSSMDQPAFATCRIALYSGDTLILGEEPEKTGADTATGEKVVNFRGHSWRFVAEPRTSVLAGGTLPVMILVLGLLLGAAVSAAVFGLRHALLRTRMALAAAERLTGEISEREQAERSLKESEARLGVVLDSATGVAVIAFDPEGKVTYFSRGAERLLGWNAAEMLGQKAMSLIHDPDEVAVREETLTAELGVPVSGFETLSAIPSRNGSERREWTYVRRDGSHRVVDLVVTLLQEEAGGPPKGLLSTAIDITERQQMERDLRDSLLAKKAAQSLLESAGRIARLGHWELALEDEGPLWSDITCAIHEVPDETRVTLTEAIGFYHPEDQSKISLGVKEALSQGKMFDYEARLITANGKQIWVHSRGEPVRDENGVITGLQGVIQDINERHKTEELLRQRNQLLEEATARAEEHARAKTEFLANMSHEIRTPLNAVIGMSELLMSGSLDRRERDLVATIHSSGDVLLGLINDILDFSKIESGQLELERIPVPLRDCVESVLDLLAGQAAEKKLELIGHVDPKVPAMIMGDPTRLRQVLVNLVGNALKFTKEGEVLLELKICQEAGCPLLEFAVTDTGIGIAPGQRDRLFHAFTQVDASMTRRFGGTGLGLAICNRLIQHMGGNIWVESEEDKGSTFRFRIPFQPCLAARQPQSTPSPAQSTKEEESCSKPLAGQDTSDGLAGRTVLLVDDNATFRRILTAQLVAWSMRPASCATVREAMAWLAAADSRCRVDLVILDAALVSGDGEAPALEFRRLPSCADLPILALTSVGDRSRDLKTEGWSAVLSKPMKSSALRECLTCLLAANQASHSPPEKPAPDAESTTALPGVVRPLRILVAEDNPVNQRVVALHLQRMGYRPSLASNGQEAVDAVLREPFDVMLLDVQMPVMDGLEAAREISRQCPRLTRPWIIALTANAFGSDRDQCLEAGMDDYLSKPIRSGTLERALKSAYELRQAQK